MVADDQPGHEMADDGTDGHVGGPMAVQGQPRQPHAGGQRIGHDRHPGVLPVLQRYDGGQGKRRRRMTGGTRTVETSAAFFESLEEPCRSGPVVLAAADVWPLTSGQALENVAVSYTHLRAHETDSYLVCRLLL